MKKIKNWFSKMRFGVHPAFFVLLIFCSIFGGVTDLLTMSGLAILHERGHAICAKHLGYRLTKIRLLPSGAALCGDDFFLPSDEIKIAICGPLVNAVVCVLCVATMWIWPDCYHIFRRLFELSLCLAVFNLLPFFPLDGARVFLGILGHRFDRKSTLFLLKIISCCFGVVLLVLFVASLFFEMNLSFAMFGVSILSSNLVGSKDAKYERFVSKDFKRKKLKTGLVVREIEILGDATILDAMQKVEARFFTKFLVVDNNFKEFGFVEECELEDFAAILGAKTSLKKLVLIKKSLTNQKDV